MAFKLARGALAAALCASLGLPAQGESVVGGGAAAPTSGGGFSAAGLLGRGRSDSDRVGPPASVQGQFLASSVSSTASNSSPFGRGRSDDDVDAGIHKPGQFKKPPVTPPVGGITPPLPGSRHAPEPASIALLSIGALGCAVAGGLRRRKRRLEAAS